MSKKFCLLILFFIINNSWAALHDPTKPIMNMDIETSATMQQNFNLQSILIGPMRRVAMINGQLVGTGSSIQGARILAIGKNHVVLLIAGRKEILYLFGKRMWKTH